MEKCQHSYRKTEYFPLDVSSNTMYYVSINLTSFTIKTIKKELKKRIDSINIL